jgi:hypothetical protein
MHRVCVVQYGDLLFGDFRSILVALSRRLGAEFIGTFWLVLGGCGSAVLTANFPDVGIGILGVALAFGLTVLTMAYAFGHISGGHFNPAPAASPPTGTAIIHRGSTAWPRRCSPRWS